MSITRASVLRDRNFVLLWSGNGVSLMGTFGAKIAYPILALEISGSPITAGWVSFASSVPNLLFYVHAGIVADYANCRRTMIRCQLLGAATSAVLTLWILVGAADLPAVLVTVALCEGIIFSYFSLAELAAIRDLVPREQYGVAFSLYEAEQPAAILVGRVLGASFLGWARWIPFAGNFASYAVSVGSIVAVRGDFSPVARPEPQLESLWSRTREGYSWIRKSRFIGLSTIATAITNALFQTTILLLIVQSHREERPEWVIGTVLASAGAGGVLGAVLAPRITRAFAPSLVFVAGLWIWAVALLPMALTSNPLALAVSWCGVGGVGTVISVVNTLGRIEAVPADALGRLVGLASLITSGAVPLGAALGGYVLATWGVHPTAWALPSTVALLALVGTAALHRERAAAAAGDAAGRA